MEVDAKPVRSIEGWIILITNIHEEATESDLQDAFADFGPIKNLHLNLDRRTGYVKGYALLEYASKEESEHAIAEMNGKTMLGQTIRVGFAFIEPPSVLSKTRNDDTQEERQRSVSPR